MRMKRNESGQSLYEAVASLITPAGVKQNVMQNRFQRLHGKVWNSASVSPALTYLSRVGVLKREGSRGPNRVLKLARRYDAKRDDDAISMAMSEQHAAAANLHRKGNGAVSFTSTKFMIAVGEKDTVVLDGKQAQALWKELDAIFGARS